MCIDLSEPKKLNSTWRSSAGDWLGQQTQHKTTETRSCICVRAEREEYVLSRMCEYIGSMIVYAPRYPSLRAGNAPRRGGLAWTAEQEIHTRMQSRMLRRNPLYYMNVSGLFYWVWSTSSTLITFVITLYKASLNGHWLIAFVIFIVISYSKSIPQKNS